MRADPDDVVDLDSGPDADLGADRGGNAAPRTPGRRTGPAARTGDQRTRRRLAVVALVLAVAVLVPVLAVRHRAGVTADAAAAEAAEQARRGEAWRQAWRVQQEDRARSDAHEEEALQALPDDVEELQRVVGQALAAAGPRRTPLPWSTAWTSAVRSQAVGADGALVDVSRGAATTGAPLDPATPVTGVVWRTTTAVRPVDTAADGSSDPCSAPLAVPAPDGSDGLPAPACAVRETTSPSGERQLVALRTWERLLRPPSGSSREVVQVVHEAVLVVDGRRTWSVAASGVGAPGARGSTPPYGPDQVALAVRWAADAERGLPTPAPLGGTPLPGFDG